MISKEKQRLKIVADNWINKWWDEVHSPTATDLLAKLLIREAKRAEKHQTDAFLMLKVLNACIEKRTLPRTGSACHRKLMAILNDKGEK